MFIPRYVKATNHKYEVADSELLKFPFLVKKKTKLNTYSEDKVVEESEINDANAKIFNPDKYSLKEISNEELEVEDEKFVTMKCGRVRFENMKVPPGAPANLICEECEKAYSILRCDACDQVMCAKCADLCHPRSVRGTKVHDHEAKDKIRPLQRGDSSRIPPVNSFALPACDVFEEDFLKLKDLSVPNSLASYGIQLKPVQSTFSIPKFEANENVIFKDPVSGKDAYGRVLSEWDFLHGEVGPSVKRGEGSSVWFIVEMKALIDNVNDISEIMKLARPIPPPIEYPILEGLKDRQCRFEYYKARDISRNVEKANIVRSVGPINHFTAISSDTETYLNNFHFSKLSKEDISSQFQVILPSDLPLQNPSVSQNRIVDHALGYLSDDIINSMEYLKYHKTKEYIRRAINILVLPEHELVKPEEKAEVLNKARFDAMENIIERVFMKLLHRYLSLSFGIWKGNMEHLKEQQQHYCARRIQTAVRRWLCRDVLEELQCEWEDTLYNRWRRLHERFHYCDPDYPYCVTMDGKVFFETSNYANRYAECLLKTVSKIMKFTDRKRLTLLRLSLKRWKTSAIDFFESNMQGHFSHECIDPENPEDVKDIESQKKIDMASFELMHRKGVKAIGIDEFEPDNVSTLPLAIHRTPIKIKDFIDSVALTSTSPTSPTSPNRPRSPTSPKSYEGSSLDSSAWKVSRYRNQACTYVGREVFPSLDSELETEPGSKNRSPNRSRGRSSSNAVASSSNEEPSRDRRRSHAASIVGEDVSRDRSQSVHSRSRSRTASVTNRSQSMETNDETSNFDTRSSFRMSLLAPGSPGIASQLAGDSPSNSRPSSSLAKSNIRRVIAPTSGDNEMEIEIDVPVTIPPVMARDGIDLPPLRPLKIPLKSEDFLSFEPNRLHYCSFKAYMEGPTPDSCWIIPGRLAMGKLPTRSVHKQHVISAPSCIFLAGINTFVSLLSTGEEARLQKEMNFPSVFSTLEGGLSAARYASNQLVIVNNHIISEQNEILLHIPNFYHSDPRYAQAHKDRLRCKAKMKMAQDAVKKATNQLKLIPKDFCFLRIPLPVDAVPTVNEILPVLWELEQRLAQGDNIFLYSREGHGRVGLIAAALLGRLYGLTSMEALYRVQACHDSAKCEEERSIPVHCPQLVVQRRLVEDILSLSNRGFQGVVWRSQSNPETYGSETHHLERGLRYDSYVTENLDVTMKESVRFSPPWKKHSDLESQLDNSSESTPKSKSKESSSKKTIILTPSQMLLTSSSQKALLGNSRPLESASEMNGDSLSSLVLDEPLEQSRPSPARRPKLPLLRTLRESAAQIPSQ